MHAVSLDKTLMHVRWVRITTNLKAILKLVWGEGHYVNIYVCDYTFSLFTRAINSVTEWDMKGQALIRFLQTLGCTDKPP